jgi:photosystem II stability/assembly factor-like uncharacterized protein
VRRAALEKRVLARYRANDELSPADLYDPQPGKLVGPGNRQTYLPPRSGLYFNGDGGHLWRVLVPRLFPPSARPISTNARPIDIGVQFEQVQFLNSSDGWVVMLGAAAAPGFAGSPSLPSSFIDVSRTTNGGNSWQGVKLPSSVLPPGAVFEAVDMSFINDHVGWLDVQRMGDSTAGAAYGNVILTTSNGGATWTTVNQNAPVGYIMATSVSEGLGLGTNDSSLYRTADGGRTWAPCNIPGAWQVLTVPEQVGNDDVLLGVPAHGTASVLVSTDHGDTWAEVKTPIVPQVNPLLPGAQIPFAATKNALYYWAGGRFFTSSDLGRQWSSWFPNLAFTSGNGAATALEGGGAIPPWDPLQFSSATVGWAVASTQSASGPSVLLRTNDGGHTFVVVPTPDAAIPTPHFASSE